VKTKCFVSYDHSEDAVYKWLLQAWDANPDFDFEFDSRGPGVAIDSETESVIQGSLTSMMKSATHLLALVGAKSAQSKWMRWEIARAQEADVRLRIAAVRLALTNPTPAGLQSPYVSWATSFERDRIVDALRKAVVL
jgi:hypothetical protein